MRGRTNYTGGAMPVINGTIKNYEVAQGSTINKGDFVELVYDDATKPFVGYRTSAQRVIRLTDGTWIVAVRATTGYQWVLRAIEIVDGEIVIKNDYIPTIGDGTVKTSQDLQLVALENNRFAYHALTPDTWSDGDGYSHQHCCILLKYENGKILYLSKHYYNLSTSSSIDYSGMTPICACSDQRIVLGVKNNQKWYKVLSYKNDTLSVLTDETLFGNWEPDGVFLKIPGVDSFISIENESSYVYVAMIKLLEDNTITRSSYISSELGPSLGIPNNVAWIDETRFLILCGYETTNSKSHPNTLNLLQVNTSSVSIVSKTKTQTLTQVQQSNTGGAIISLGDGYFLTIEGKGVYLSGVLYERRVNVITLWHIDTVNTITAIDVVEFTLDGMHEISGDGFIIVDNNGNGVYIEDNKEKANTTYFKFKVVGRDKIEFVEGNVYIRKYSRRAEGFANQSGIGGDVIEVYVP